MDPLQMSQEGAVDKVITLYSAKVALSVRKRQVSLAHVHFVVECLAPYYFAANDNGCSVLSIFFRHQGLGLIWRDLV